MTDLDPDELAAALVEATAQLTCELHGAVAALRRQGVARHLAAPVAAIFEQPPGGAKPRHRAGRPSGELVALAADAAERVRALAGDLPGPDNPALEPLALACFYGVDARRTAAFGLRRRASSRPLAQVLDDEAARRDPELPVGTALIRIWSELAGEPPMCVQLRLRG
jgi:hypothetical protein